MKPDIVLDLSDLGLGENIPVVAKQKTVPGKPSPRGDHGERIHDVEIGIARSTTMLVTRHRCDACGSTQLSHHGVFLEVVFRSHREFRRLFSHELSAHRELPRRLEHLTEETIPVCTECWAFDELVQHVFDARQEELPFDAPSAAIGTLDLGDLAHG